MSQACAPPITLGVLGVLLSSPRVWGWTPPPSRSRRRSTARSASTPRSPQGEKVFPQQVTVSVYNAGTREGLAGRTMQQLTDAGFAEGDSGNAAQRQGRRASRSGPPTPQSPAVQLVASRLGEDVEIVERRDGPGLGVTVRRRRRVRATSSRDSARSRPTADAEICSPPVD